MPLSGIYRRLISFQLLAIGIGVALMLTAAFYVFIKEIETAHNQRLMEFSESLLGNGFDSDLDESGVVAEIIDRERHIPLQSDLPWYFISSDSGVIYAGDRRSVAVRTFARLDEVAGGAGTGYISAEVDGSRFKVYRSQIHPGLYLNVVYSWDDLSAPVAHGIGVAAILFFLLLALLGIGNWYLTRRTLRPIEEMIAVTQRISELGIESSDTETSAIAAALHNDRREDEIAQLRRNFVIMLEKIRDAIDAERRLVADTAHDVLDPVTILRSELQSEEIAKLGPDVSLRFRRALRQIDEIQRMSADLLLVANFGRSHSPVSEEPIDLNELLLEVVGNQLSPASVRSIAIRTDIPEEEIICRADRIMLQRILARLVDNIVTFAPEGSTVNVALRQLDACAEVVVSDMGVDFDKEGGPESTTTGRSEPVAGESTLDAIPGMRITREIVQTHGGTLSFSSPPGSGSTLTLCFPLHLPDLRLP